MELCFENVATVCPTAFDLGEQLRLCCSRHGKEDNRFNTRPFSNPPMWCDQQVESPKRWLRLTRPTPTCCAPQAPIFEVSAPAVVRRPDSCMHWSACAQLTPPARASLGVEGCAGWLPSVLHRLGQLLALAGGGKHPIRCLPGAEGMTRIASFWSLDLERLPQPLDRLEHRCLPPMLSANQVLQIPGRLPQRVQVPPLWWPPDLAPCATCLAELVDPFSRPALCLSPSAPTAGPPSGILRALPFEPAPHVAASFFLLRCLRG